MSLKAVGIITEYNPFHNGHKFQLEKAKLETGADLAVIVMSSNWTQRGEPAIYDKWVRTQMALENGADLVIELPIQDAVQPASIFAEKAVDLVSAIRCTYLSFGCENPEWDFMKLAEMKLPKQDNLGNPNNNFPAVFQAKLAEETGFNLTNPNDTLAFWYAVANQQLKQKLHLVPIKRNQSGHNDSEFRETIASGRSIRKAIHNHEDSYLRFLPPSSFQLNGLKPMSWDDFWPYLQYELTQSDTNDLRQIYQMNEGLENRFKEKVMKAESFGQFLEAAKTKRYTYARLQRLATYTLFQMKRSAVKDNPDVLRVLGMNAIGQAYLKQVRGKTKLPIISKIGKDEFEHAISLECKSGILVSSVNGRRQDLYRHPIIL